MEFQPIELIMSNVAHEPVDLVHQVISVQGSIWENPYNPARSIVDQSNNYRKYSHYLANLLFLKVEPQTEEYNKLLKRAKELKKLVFECTCYPAPCHLDALRIRLTRDLEALGYNIVTNGTTAFGRPKSSDTDEV